MKPRRKIFTVIKFVEYFDWRSIWRRRRHSFFFSANIILLADLRQDMHLPQKEIYKFTRRCIVIGVFNEEEIELEFVHCLFQRWCESYLNGTSKIHQRT